MNARRAWDSFVTAVQFLTRVPLPGGMNRPNPDLTLLRSAVIFFPLVGAIIGALTGCVIWSALQLWPPFLAVLLGLIFEAFLTGAFHEDAVADCADAFGGGWTAEDVLRIMKDSRVGSFGALGLGLAVMTRGGALALCEPAHLIAISTAASTLGRWGILLMMKWIPPVPNREGLSKDIAEQLGWREVVLGTLLAIPGVFAYVIFEPARLAIGLLVIVAIVLAWGRYVVWRIGGVTGDCLGAACYFAQIAILLVAIAKPTLAGSP